MKEILSNLAQLISLNTHEAYLDLEKKASGYTLWVIEKGTGGCTFPSMEILAENLSLYNDNLSLTNEILLNQIMLAKEKIKKDNPHFYDTVFK